MFDDFVKHKLTIPQENIYLVESSNNNTNMNNIFGVFKICKKLDIEILKVVMNKIIENNDALRIKIIENNNVPEQYVDDFKYEDIPVYILEEEDEIEVNRIIRKIADKRLEMINSKLYDIRIIQNKIATYVCVKIHHINSDAWTLGQVAEQIKEYYLKISNNEEITMNPSYLEYIKKDEKYRLSDKYLIDKEYWNEYVKELDCENKFEIAKDKKSRRLEKQISLEMYQEIDAFCKTNKITEYVFFLATISIYFSKIFNKESMVIGTPFLNRRKADKELEMMGMFISTLPINIQTKNEMNFIDICKNINSTNMQCFRHSKYPYYEIQRAYQEFSKENINLYEIAFSYQINKLEVEIDGDTGETTWISNNNQANPLLISYVNHFGEHLLYYDYILKCLSKNDIDNIHERILLIIEQVLNNALIEVKDINILSKQDVQLLKKFNNTGNAEKSNETIISRFENMVANNKDKIAVVCGKNSITYKDLNDKANSLCKKILQQGIEKNSPIVILLDNDIDFITSIIGVLKSGNYYIPILPEEETRRMQYIINDSKAKIVITNKKYLNKIANEDLIKIDINSLKFNNKNNYEIETEPSDICYLIYTSGTTGKPKGVIMKNENIISLVNSMNLDEDLKYIKNDVAISLLKHSFDASAIDIYSTLLNGGKLVLVPKEDELNPEKVVNIIKNENVTRVFTVHKWIEQIQKISIDNKIKLNKLRIIGTGAEVLKPRNFEKLLQINSNLRIYNTYGPTEATMFMTKHKVNEQDIANDYAPIGKLMPNVRAMIISRNNQALPINVQGELAIFEDEESSKNIAGGYFNQKSLTKEKFIQIRNPLTNELCNAYKTGDIAKINNNLELEFLGREDDFVKVAGGYLVSLNEVEQRIRELVGNNIEIAAIAMPIKNIKTILLYISKKGQSNNVKNEEIKNVIDENITFYMRPKHIIEIEEIPRNKNGKVDRNKLEEIAKKYIKSKNIDIKPQTTLEQMIYDKVKEIVKCDFSITDDFEDDLGLDSLNMTNLYIQLKNINMTIQDLYNYSTVKDLADMMKTELIPDGEKTKKTSEKIKNNSQPMNLETVMLTGVTGFVGVNLLKELANNTNTKKIFCIVRTKIGLSSKERFEETIQRYFDEVTCKKIIKKTTVLNGDLTREDLGLTDEEYKALKMEVKTIVNCAANVKHVGKYNNFYRDNVKTVINLINICKENNISLAHISTLSLHGFQNKNVNMIFDENVLNINQTFDKSPYLISKYEAEQKVLKAINSGLINAKIFRIGNIMPRLSDGVFQSNFEQNAFMLAIKEINNIGLQTVEMIDSEFYLTPVDECVQAINKILKSDCKNTIYHIESDKSVKVSDIIKIIKKKGNELNTSNISELREKLYENYNVGVEHLNAIINQNTNQYSKEITINVLNKLNFKWNNIDEKYLRNIVNIASKIS